MSNPRIIGTHSESTHGALFFVVTSLHGNEPAGEKAVRILLRLLQEEKVKNPNFDFSGKMVGLLGNMAAKAKNRRYIDTDMNRIWTADRISFIEKENESKLLYSEEREIKAMLQTMRSEIAAYQPSEIFILDLHTTTADGGIFTIVPNNPVSESIGMTLFAPVITGFAGLLEGTLMSFFDGVFEGLKCTTLTFESGQHEDEESVTNAISAMINMLRAIGCVKSEDVEDKHDKRLRERAALLPRKAELIYRHAIQVSDNFKMKPGYQNFQAVKKKEILAEDRKGSIKAKDDAFILMPLYQKQGNDGFFLVKKIE
jgi:succinylglutamate desuccinylase